MAPKPFHPLLERRFREATSRGRMPNLDCTIQPGAALTDLSTRDSRFTVLESPNCCPIPVVPGISVWRFGDADLPGLARPRLARGPPAGPFQPVARDFTV